MVSNKNAKKARKPIETTLGKAPVKTKEKETDMSHLRKPIETSVSGIKQILSIIETATNEVKNMLMYECDIMYECRTCRTIFRSLANFILHKRNYCKEKMSSTKYINCNDTLKLNADTPKEPKIETSSLGKVIQRLHEIDRVRESAKQLVTVDLSLHPGNEPIKSMYDLEEKASSFNNMVLEKIESNSSGIFQTLVNDSSSNNVSNHTNRKESMKAEVMEIHKKLENDVPVLDPEGKICGFTTNKLHQASVFPKSKFKCTECSHRFATQKSLTNHVKYVHNPSRIVYICPTCKDPFANPWCVYRHLLKVHRMTNKQVRRMREQVHNSCIRRGDESLIQRKKSSEVIQSEGNSENQWINDIEGDKDFQMCAGCGKHFERKAALHAHSQMCAKRLEVCNNIKESAKKKGEEEPGEKAKLNKELNSKMVLKGASKRKGQYVCSYRRKQNDLSSEISEPVSVSNYKTDSDVSNHLDSNEQEAELPKSIKHVSTRPDSMFVRDVRNDTNSSRRTLSTEDLFPEKIKDTHEIGQTDPTTKEHESMPKRTSARGSRIIERSRKQHQSELYVDIQEIPNIPPAGPTARCKVRSKSLVDSTEPLLISSGSSREIISRSESGEEAIYLSSDESSEEAQKISSSIDNTIMPIKREKLDKDDTYSLSLESVNSRGSVCVISDNNDCNEGAGTVLQDSSDLFSNDVSFEMFCKKVATVEKSNEGSKKTHDNHARTLRKRKRKFDVDKEFSENEANKLKYLDNQDDVIFVGETINRASNVIEVENGFPGFSTEETSQIAFSVDLSNLSYNNPLKSKTKDTPGAPQARPSNESKSKTEDMYMNNETLPKDVKNEFNFMARAAPYMDHDRLLCIPCGLTFKSLSLLLWHMSAHFSWFRFQCSRCSFISFNKNDCMSHAQNGHNLKENAASGYILPLPNWKTVLMSHEFRLLKDCDDLRGKHTDEKIGIDENNDQQIESAAKVFESDAALFGDCSTSSEELGGMVLEKDIVKKHSKFGKIVIDIMQETMQDFQKLPEPVELAMPADVSEVFRTFTFDDDLLSADESVETLDHYADESNDDWGLSKVYEFKVPAKPILHNEETLKNEIMPVNIRPSRMRTKVKQDEDFVYYDNDFNNALKVTELFKNGSQKSRSDAVVTVKPKISNKSVPTTQKRKS